MRLPGICLNWKVVGGLAIVAGAVWIVSPARFVGALPLLAVLACPISMVVMMRGMNANGAISGPRDADLRAGGVDAMASHELAHPGSNERQESLAELRARLVRLRARQGSIARQIAALSAAPNSDPLIDATAPAAQPGASAEEEPIGT